MTNHDRPCQCRQNTTQIRDHTDGYEALGPTSVAAAEWANLGFVPNEAAPHIQAGLPDSALGDTAEHYGSIEGQQITESETWLRAKLRQPWRTNPSTG